ncbi:MAG: F0F1 ATP synthase subunit delta [candidate division Zixibacteria bacterium]|nr:F0F1 ATP synthase subunit delta [candidate division Zixibacteria bacterium]
MIERQVPKRYARALFDAAQKQDLIDPVSEELAVIRNIISTDEALINFLDAPQVTDKDKFQLLEDVFKDKFSDLIYSFVKLTVEKRRSMYLLDIINAFTNLVEDEKGIVRARAITAVKMELDQKDKLVKKLEGLTGKNIILYPTVDKNIIGGVIINMNNMVIDDSVRNKLGLMRNRLISLKVH